MQDVLNYYKAVINANNNTYKLGKWGQFVGGKQAFDCVCIIKACAWEVPINKDITANQYSYIANHKSDMPDVSIGYFYDKATERSEKLEKIPNNKLSFVYHNFDHIGLYNPAEGLVYECVAGHQNKVASHPLDYYKGTPYMWNKWSNGAYFEDSYVNVPKKETVKQWYRVQVGSFTIKENAINFAVKLRRDGFSALIKQYGKWYRVQVGAYEIKENANNMRARLIGRGYADAYVTAENGSDVPF